MTGFDENTHGVSILFHQLNALDGRTIRITAGMSDSDVRELNERLERERRRAANRRGE